MTNSLHIVTEFSYCLAGFYLSDMKRVEMDLMVDKLFTEYSAI